MENETKKILDEKIGLTATCVRVPVKTSHAESANIEFENEYDLDTVRKILENAPGCKVVDEHKDGKLGIGKTGRNSNGSKNYGGPCPPNGVHVYNIKVYALNIEINKSLGEMTQKKFEKKYKNEIISSSMISGKYK